MIDFEGDRLALMVKCPVCKKKPGEPCVYLMPQPSVSAKTGERYVPHGRYGAQYQAQLRRAGTPTQRPHNDRRSAGRQWEAMHKYQTATEAFRKAARASESQREIARASNEFMLREYDQLKTWLRFFADIFRE